MMAEREKVISTFEKIIRICKEDGCDFVDLTFEDAEQILALLKEQESRWVSIPHKKDRVCERCGYDEPYKNAEKETMIYKFCPNCGARMEGR